MPANSRSDLIRVLKG